VSGNDWETRKRRAWGVFAFGLVVLVAFGLLALFQNGGV